MSTISNVSYDPGVYSLYLHKKNIIIWPTAFYQTGTDW